MLKSNIKSDGKDIFTSGSFMTFSGGENTITISDENEKLEFILTFQKDEKDSNARWETEIINNQTLKLIFLNYNNPLGSFSTEPIEVGTLFSRKLYFAYFIIHLNETELRKIDYSFYLGEEVANGSN
jgi:hypothetical protein